MSLKIIVNALWLKPGFCEAYRDRKELVLWELVAQP
ncbi:hypothetical protein FOQG_05974 [Fusarium oxysporum f. sp. raphani 54005]|uniref:Uncharacterized protein n=6 Tax=Fusarium oxysporum TaxID=5507 RepID=X0CC31_FUSOX|nr:hypothetical protein FOXG_20334 [Fusarium oxysporum f. sp. lycopersici 4287]EWZ38505.1 hypothetical protein FOZG_10091 [Fusarium oxysporum Fo47]EWZ81419.1 hypothetical protein FOWG_14943 [Fusarium oxysporum f. sp. lycopersici MN25]EXA46093.1 hypothetical protein FOVG_06860 [Fusarium oxysporum f. sp. pisi HDV247]EXK40599.1 hypothetical protein FOMG_07386 [Fusarium oxysporum f. sp. melonis 26406]EXK91990.1 hypothetical protein FOQG_05974 [Fusarium oxysporum f. sp. raphani 54005]EXL57967.1 hy